VHYLLIVVQYNILRMIYISVPSTCGQVKHAKSCGTF